MNTTIGTGRPRVVCHMMSSVDGRIVADRWPLSSEAEGNTSWCTGATSRTAGYAGV